MKDTSGVVSQTFALRAALGSAPSRVEEDAMTRNMGSTDRIVRGIDVSRVESGHEARSMSRDETFPRDLDRIEELERELGVRFGERTLLVTFHPPTLARDAAERLTFATYAIVVGKSPGGVFNASGDADMTGGTAHFNNQGLFNKTAGAAAADSAIDWVFNNTGTTRSRK